MWQWRSMQEVAVWCNEFGGGGDDGVDVGGGWRKLFMVKRFSEFVQKLRRVSEIIGRSDAKNFTRKTRSLINELNVTACLSVTLKRNPFR